MNCPYCRKEAQWVANEQVYGRRYGKSYMCYWCKDCDAYVGCHNNTKTPLGTMANKPLRELRKKVHSMIDPLWKSKKYSRGMVYARLNDTFGKDIHVGEADEVMCEELIATVPLIFLTP